MVTGDCGARAGVGTLSFCILPVKTRLGMTHPRAKCKRSSDEQESAWPVSHSTDRLGGLRRKIRSWTVGESSSSSTR